MSSEYGYKLDPNRKHRKQRAIKGIRRTVVNTYNPETISQNGILSIKFPKLGEDDVIVPGSTKVSFNITLTSGTDANRTIVNNLGRAIIKKMVVKIENKEVYSLEQSDIFHCYQDLWKTENERENATMQGIMSEGLRKHRISAGDKDADAKNTAIATACGSKFYIPLDFELLEGEMPFYSYDFYNSVAIELQFNNYGRVIVSSDTTASYAISNIELKYEVVNSPHLVKPIKMKHTGRNEIPYDNILFMEEKNVNKSDTVWNWELGGAYQSMKGVLVLFVDPADGGEDYDRDSEKFYNPKITSVSTRIDGRSNQVYENGMKPEDQFDEIYRYFADGKYRPLMNIVKNGHFADVTLGEYLTTKYALWIDLRTTEDNSLHGTGRAIDSANSINLEIRKTAEVAGALKAYMFTILDSKLIFEGGMYKDKAQ